jgi:pyruvate formate lyase activating enzyme
MQYYKEKNQHAIVCLLCRHYCTLQEGKNGICGVNYNKKGKLFNATYGHPSALNLDPVEKKPLYHFMPATTSLSLGTVGCNFRCPFCQNYSISQTSQVDERIELPPQKVVDLALEYGASSISYTYNEPVIWYPYAKDIGVLAKEAGLKNIFVSSGYESPEVLEDMQSWIDGVNIDLKSFSPHYYKKVLKTNLEGVKESLIAFAKSDIWLEVTTLVIPAHNDSQEELEGMATFIAEKLGKDVPWHLSAFHPNYKMQDTPPTPLQTLQKAKSIAQNSGLRYVYIGNVMGEDNATYCPQCKTKLIDRNGYNTQVLRLEDGKCGVCSTPVAGVWS